jgi:hypothetical protein
MCHCSCQSRTSHFALRQRRQRRKCAGTAAASIAIPLNETPRLLRPDASESDTSTRTMCAQRFLSVGLKDDAHARLVCGWRKVCFEKPSMRLLGLSLTSLCCWRGQTRNRCIFQKITALVLIISAAFRDVILSAAVRTLGIEDWLSLSSAVDALRSTNLDRHISVHSGSLLVQRQDDNLTILNHQAQVFR